jgi:hypothetical protein
MKTKYSVGAPIGDVVVSASASQPRGRWFLVAPMVVNSQTGADRNGRTCRG